MQTHEIKTQCSDVTITISLAAKLLFISEILVKFLQ